MTLSQVSIEILEFLLTLRATLRSNRQSTHDALNVRIERRKDKTLCNDVVFVAQGAWTILMSCEGIIDGCPSLASVLCDNQHTSAAENEACDGNAYMRYVAVNQSKEESCIVSLESGGLHIIHEGACPAVQSTQAEAEVTITLKCSSTLMELTKCATDVRNFLFKFKLVHPLISLCLSSTCDELDAYNFGEDQFEYASVCHGISMITDPRYFISSDRVQGAPCHHLTPVSEGSFVFLSPSLSTSESRLSLRCVAVATLIPPSKPTQAQVVNPSQLWLSVYGPGSFPLVYPASTPMEAQLNLKHLAKWEDLGLTLADGELEAEPGSPNLPIRDCFSPDLKASFTGCTSSSESSPIIHLMLFLKENFKGYATSASARLALLNRVRQEFPHICSQQLSRIQKIVHDTLAKLLGSSSPAARKDRASIMKAAVPSCVSSLHNIISHSTNDTFRRRCLDAVQASNCIELSDQLSKHFITLCERPHGQQWTEHSQSAVDSQGQFPSEGDDQDGGRVPSDESNLTSSSSSSSLMPHHQEPSQDTLFNTESEENADFDLLDETRLQHCNFMVGDQGTIPGRYSVPQQSPCPSPHKDQPSSYSSTLTAIRSSTLSSMSASSQLPSSSALPRASLEVPPRSLAVTPSTPQGQPRPLAAAPSTCCSSVTSGSSFSSQHCPHDDSHFHGVTTPDETEISSRSSDAEHAPCDKERRDEVQDSDVQMMQESLSGELGNDWFETLMDHDDWMSNEI